MYHLDAIEHSYPFSFDLPENLSSTFPHLQYKGSARALGAIKYQMNVLISIQGGKDDPSVDAKILVQELIDINTQELLEDKEMDEQETFGNCCCPGGLLKLEVTSN